MTTTVPTLTGEISPKQLGRTLIHEHVIMLGAGGVIHEWPMLWDRDAAIEASIASLLSLAQTGIDSLVDMTTFDLGRDIEAVAEVARAVPINIIVCTGAWLAAPQLMLRYSPSRLADAFVQDIEKGIKGTDLRAGIIKVATNETVDDLNRLLLTAVAEAHRRTGAPVGTHSNPRAHSGSLQQDVFEARGVDLGRVVIGHSGDTSDLEHLRNLMDRGSYIGMDRFGLDRVPSSGEVLLTTEQRVATIAALCRDGYASKIMLGHDANCVHMAILDRPSVDAELPNWHHRHIPRDVVPLLLEHGVSAEDVDTMLVSNPREFFSQGEAY